MKNTIQNHLDRNKIKNAGPVNQKQLAEMLGLKREYINRITKGHLTPTVPLAMRISNALGYSLDDGIGKVFILK